MDRPEVACNEGEEITRLGKRILPAGEMLSPRQLARLDQIAVREEHRIRAFVAFDTRLEPCEIVRPIEKIGDGAKALWLALGAIYPAGHVQALERRVLCGGDLCRDFQREFGRGRVK